MIYEKQEIGYMIALRFDDILKGDTARFTKTISETDVYLFAGICGDFNPLHVNEEFAKCSPFQKRIVHGLLVASLISAVLGTKLPGQNSIYISQTLQFLAPAYIGDTVTAEVTVVEKDNNKKEIILETKCFNEKGKDLVNGTARLLMRV